MPCFINCESWQWLWKRVTNKCFECLNLSVSCCLGWVFRSENSGIEWLEILLCWGWQFPRCARWRATSWNAAGKSNFTAGEMPGMSDWLSCLFRIRERTRRGGLSTLSKHTQGEEHSHTHHVYKIDPPHTQYTEHTVAKERRAFLVDETTSPLTT